MTRLLTSGFETRSLFSDTWGGTDFTAPVIDTTTFRSGSASMKATGTTVAGSRAWITLSPAPATTIWLYTKTHVFFPSLPAGENLDLALIVDSNASTPLVTARLTTTGKLQLWNMVGNAQLGSDSVATLAANTWARVELACMVNTAGTDSAELKINGELVATATGLTLSSSVINGFFLGWHSPTGANRTFTVYHDDVVVNSGDATAPNAYPGDTKIAFLLPTADSANTGFAVSHVGDTLWGSVSQVPAKGTIVTDTATVNSKIKDATSNTTDNYQATLQTYAAAGIARGDNIVLVRGICLSGNSTTTQRTIGITGVSNPAIAEATDVTGTTAAGTYPTGWGWTLTAVAVNPAVTKATAPVLKFRKGTASVDSIMLTLIGLIVEYVSGPTVGRSRSPKAASRGHPVSRGRF